MTATALQSSEPSSDEIVDHALYYASRGWEVFPCHPSNKEPFTTRGFKDASRDGATIRAWWTEWPRAMIGMRTGKASGVWAIDPDVPKSPGGPDGLAAWGALLAKHQRIHTHAHLTPSGGQHLLFKWRDDRPVTNKEGALRGTGINVRGEGGYIIVPPSRRLDGAAYGIAEPLDFFSFSEAPDWLYDLILQPEPRQSISERAVAQMRPPHATNRAYCEAALRAECTAVATAQVGERNATLNNAALKLGTIVGAGALTEGEVIGGLYDAATTNGYVASDGQRAAMATINSGLRAGIARPRLIPERSEPSRGSWTDEVEAHPPQPKISATPWVWKTPASLPRRQWLYGYHLIRKYCSMTVAHPGVGKSALVLAEALAMATGRDLLGVLPRQRCRVWYWQGEDPQEETDRRIAAACLHYKISPEDLAGYLLTDSGRDQEIIIARDGRDGPSIAVPVVEALVETILANEIDVLSIDPFVSSHRVAENDNTAIELVAAKWNQIAEQTNCAIELVHHCRKTGGNAVEVEDGRGASALLAKSRSGRVLNVMTKEEGERAGVVRPRAYFRVENGKLNLAPAPESADWFHIQSVHLGNGEPTNALDEGDSVGVIVSWRWPDPLDGVTGSMFDKAASAIRAGTWRESPQAGDWVGIAVANALGLNLDKPADKAKVKGMLKAWLAAGSLRIVMGEDSKRMTRKFVEVSSED